MDVVRRQGKWIPAFAGMTGTVFAGMTDTVTATERRSASITVPTQRTDCNDHFVDR
jgi:hypothetical protein